MAGFVLPDGVGHLLLAFPFIPQTLLLWKWNSRKIPAAGMPRFGSVSGIPAPKACPGFFCWCVRVETSCLESWDGAEFWEYFHGFHGWCGCCAQGRDGVKFSRELCLGFGS